MVRAAIRTCVAAGLAAIVAISAARPHLHEPAAAGRGEPCALCQLRTAEPARAPALDLAPRLVSPSDLLLPPGLPPVAGAPLGAVPGQSPPAGA